MIRFINLTGQICPDDDLEFAWYNTITDRFFEIEDCQTWHSWKEFQTELVMYMLRGKVPETEQNETLLRFRKLFPKQPKQTLSA